MKMSVKGGGGGECGPMGKHLPQEHADLNLDSQDLLKDGPAGRAHGCNQCAYGKMGGGDWKISRSSWAY